MARKRSRISENLFSYRELNDDVQESLRAMFVSEIEMASPSWQECIIQAFIAKAEMAGIIIEPQDIRFSDGKAQILSGRIDFSVTLDLSGIAKKFLNDPGDYELFLAHTTAKLRRIAPFLNDIHMLTAFVEIEPFDNNDYGKSFLACELAAELLERYLNNLVITLSDELNSIFLAAHERLSSLPVIDTYLSKAGKLFHQDGSMDNPLSLASLLGDTEGLFYDAG